MSALMPLLQQELQRQLAGLKQAMQALVEKHDAAAAAQWHRRAEALRGVAQVFPATPLPNAVSRLANAFLDPSQRDVDARGVAPLLASLEALANAPPSEAEALLVNLPATHEATANIAVTPPVSASSTRTDGRLLALFQQEVEERAAQLGRLLVQLEAEPDRLELLAPLMRAAHSIKGAARAVQNDAVVQLTHALEDALGAAGDAGRVPETLVEMALQALDLWRELAQGDNTVAQQRASTLTKKLLESRSGSADQTAGEVKAVRATDVATHYVETSENEPILRVRASLIGRMIGLAGTSMVEVRRLRDLGQRQTAFRRRAAKAARHLDELHQMMGAPPIEQATGAMVARLREDLAALRADLGAWQDDFGEFARDATDLGERLYNTAAQTRLRPFGDLVGGYPRVVRDLARELGKRARLDLVGEAVAVDRDVLERLDAPLMHLLRNALDHGIESPEARRTNEKPEEGRLQLRAGYRAGLLSIELSDDGGGIDFERIRAALVRRGTVPAEEAAAMPPEALQDFLFQSGFSTRESATEMSGRGVGLDVVRDSLRQLEGSIRISSTLGRGTTFHLQLPISRVVTRAVVVRAGDEAFAFPLLRIDRVLRFERERVVDGDGAPYLPLDGRNIGLLSLAEQLEVGEGTLARDSLLAVVVEQEGACLGFIVDAVVGEMDLATRPIDSRLGRVADVAALALLPDGEPVMLIDTDDLMRNALDQQRRASSRGFSAGRHVRRIQTILVADDSISVRELQRQILTAAGYHVEVAVDGSDAWTKLRSLDIDLLITDVDMPRMDGIELTRSVKQDARLRATPVVIVSYRDRPEDRRRGLDVHADAYVTKGDFQEDGLLRIVRDLIGAAEVLG